MSPQPTTVPTLAPTMLPSVDRVMAGTMNYSNVSTVPHNVDEFVLAMNIATSDGHNVAYNNFNFWQSTSVTGGSTTDATRLSSRTTKIRMHSVSSKQGISS